MFVIPFAHTAARTGRTPSVDQIVADTFDGLLNRRPQADAVRSPALDVSETDTAFHLAFDVPGVPKEQLKVTVEGRRVSIETAPAPTVVESADNGSAKEAAAPRTLYRERHAARYARTVSLPAEVDQTASQAHVDNGVLTLVLAKRVPTGATVLKIS